MLGTAADGAPPTLGIDGALEGVLLVVMPGTAPFVMVSHAPNPCGGLPFQPVKAVRSAMIFCCSGVARSGRDANASPPN
jgi:hypothetical protein